MLSSVMGFLKDLVFPVTCLSCGKGGSWYCPECLKKLSLSSRQRCPSCSQATENGKVCAKCSSSSYLDGVTALYEYHENPLLADFIKNLKYQLAHDSASVLPSMIRHAGFAVLRPIVSQPGKLSCIPVPLHVRRERERGFNQAHLIAKAFADFFAEQGTDVGSVSAKDFQRVRFTKPQAELRAVERKTNLIDAFAWISANAAPEQVLLVDDVFTTGSTMQECACILKKHGARWVWGLALARG